MGFRRRKSEGFNIAFLDVMSCGLGAIILIFMLVKFKTELPEDLSGNLSVELSQLQSQNTQTRRGVEKLHTRTSEHSTAVKQLNAQLRGLQNQIATQKLSNQSLEKQLSDLRKREIPTRRTTPAPVPISGKRLQDYLLGLKVEGEKIVILIDSSASMMDERLIDVIKYKISSSAKRIKAPKWERTKRIVEWLVARIPSGSQYKVIRFAGEAKMISGTNWRKGADLSDATAIKVALSKTVPGGGTNLDAAMKIMRQEAKGFTDVYVITDGLPTKGNIKLSRFFSGCASITGRGTTISGECRIKLLERIVSDYKEHAKINVILLPLEGDPFASSAFWNWTAKTQGVLISPEASWP